MVSQANIRQAARTVRDGGVIIYPTQTVYGIGGNPCDPDVVGRIRRLKQRPGGQPMLVLTDTWERVMGWIRVEDRLLQRLMEHTPPLPLTILFDVTPEAPSAVRGNSDQLGIRRTGYELCSELIDLADMPLISTSANRHGQPSPHESDQLSADLLEAVDYALRAPAPLGGSPSTVVAVKDGTMRILREGAVTQQDIQRAIDSY